MARRRSKIQRPIQIPWSETTGWHNNCGLNCLSHFIAAKLENGELQRRAAKEARYISLLNAFQTYYRLKDRPTWQDIAALLKRYPTPTDHEAILGPVLRLELGKVLKKHAETLWNTEGSAAISAYLFTGELSDIALPIQAANPEWFAQMKQDYDRRLSQIEQEPFTAEERVLAREALKGHKPPREETEETLVDQMIFKRQDMLNDEIQAELKEYWMEEGCERYAMRMADLAMSQMVSADQLSLLAQELKIGLEVTTPRGIQTKMGHSEPLWEFNVFNGGVHWEYKDPDPDPTRAREKTQEHNRFYGGDSSHLGEFQIHMEGKTNLDDLILASVQSAMTTPPGSHALALRESTSLLVQAPKAIARPQAAPLVEKTIDHALQLQAEEAMNHLVDNLEHWQNTKQLSPSEQVMIFQRYFEYIHNQYASAHPDEGGLRKVIAQLNEASLAELKASARNLPTTADEGLRRASKRQRSEPSRFRPSKRKRS